jgi:hypothetical protein
MRYVLDVNALLALVVLEHEFHARVAGGTLWHKRCSGTGHVFHQPDIVVHFFDADRQAKEGPR